MKILNKKTFFIPSKSDKGMYHEVVKVFDEWSCDCIAFQMREKCSHIPLAKRKEKKNKPSGSLDI